MSGNRKRRIAAVVATPNKQNTGMRFVNDALVAWLESRSQLEQADLFEFETPSAGGIAKERVHYGCVLDLVPERYDAIVIWGDFLVDRGWLLRACRRLSRERGTPAAEVERHARAVIFGGDTDRSGVARIFVGQCFLVSDSSYDADPGYREEFTRAARDARLFQLRDPVSYARALAFSGHAPAIRPGIDAALLRPSLTEGAATASLQAERRNLDGFGVFFGRTLGGLPAKSACLAAALGAKLGGRPHYVPWFPTRRVPRWIELGLRPTYAPLPCELEAVVERLRRLRFVITDAYHLSLVCWSIGVPALCIGRGAQRFENPIHDKKKEIFFLAQRLERFFFFAEDGFTSARRRAQAALVEIAETDPGLEAKRQIAAQAAVALADLDAALDGVGSAQ